MPRLFTLITAFMVLVSISAITISCQTNKPGVLVFSKTSGFYHESIPDGIEAIEKLGVEHGYDVYSTTEADAFNEDNLKNYSAVIFLNTTGDVLDQYQEADFERFIQAGGGFVGIHAAADTEYHWGWYGRLAGGYFLDHPRVQEGSIEVVDHDHLATEFLPGQWTRTDEWYSYKNMNDDINVLMALDEDSYEGGVQMGDHPIAWYHEYDGGRAFYTGGGHTSESYTEEMFLKHIQAGIEYAIGDNQLDYSKAITHRAPEENRFTKSPLVEGGELMEPTEMTVLPNKDVLIAQRRGEIMLYKDEDASINQVGFLDVYSQTDVPDVNAEEGVIGIQADPDFEENRFVYIFHTPADSSVNRLSRFTFEDDVLDMDSETMILEFYSKRDICCHTGGSLAFDSDGLLYISTGDNSTPFNQNDQEHVLDGYAPLDGRSGFEQYDARRTSGNSNDLRGKILRIRVNDDGSYDIPEGNLYPEGMENTRPEIYVQGNRNPYRISIDPITNYLYWGEVGPDAREDSVGVRGSLGYDEINQAREAGHFGWPFFVGDNFPYNEYDYGTGTKGPLFDPEKPVNRSPNNTGIEELSPAVPAFIWYPYTESEEFPEVGTGGRNAMAGPVYNTSLYAEETRLPEYYNGKLFIYDWIRDWIKVVTMQPNGNFDKMEPFMDSTTFNSIVDMEVGPDGRLYVLEYGNGWFAKNPDSGLSRIDFNPGNRAPVVNLIEADKETGLLPLDVVFTVDAEDPEDDPLTYVWDVGGDENIETSEPRLEHSFNQVGDVEVSVEVSDPGNLSAQSQPVSLYAGNAAPVVHIDIKGNRSFYFPVRDVEYSVSIEDEGPEGASTSINSSNLFVSADYIEAAGEEEGTEASEGHQIFSNVMNGKNLAATLDCRACHHETQSSIGPAYTKIAERYQDSTDTKAYLSNKIINGSSGAWGSAFMPAHAEMTQDDAQNIVAWIQSLVDDGETAKSLPASDVLSPTLGKDLIKNGALIITASYTDEGDRGIKPLSGNTTVSLKNNEVNATAARNLHHYQVVESGENKLLMVPTGPGSFSLNQIDLTGINTIEITAVSQEALHHGYSYEVRLDTPDGPLIGDGVIEATTDENTEEVISHSLSIKIEPITDGEYHDVYLVSKPNDEVETTSLMVNAIKFLL